MNQFVPDWNSNMGDAFAQLGGEDDGLIELLWCNGHVVMQSQASRKPPRPEKAAGIQEEEASPWFQYAVEDSLEKDLFSELFSEMPAAADAGGKACKEECGAAAAGPPQSRLMLPPRSTSAALVARGKAGFGDADGASSGSEVIMAQAAGEGTAAAEVGESSMLTIGSSVCGSNQVQAPGGARGLVVVSDTAGDSPTLPPGSGKASAARVRHDATTVTSSSMRSRPCAGKTEPSSGYGGKRKQRDTVESGSPSEDAEFESAAMACEPAQKLTTAKRRRAAEVHNLSERRRRDRINEKMKALQELIPQCNKTDKASMLDEAIEYLKSLQLQLQMMWMGGGMAPASVMFPAAAAAGVHQYMQRMGVGMGAPHLASMPRMPPFMAPAAAVQGSPVSHVPAAVTMADPYARCLAAVEHLQPPSPMHYMQGMNFYQLGAAKNLQQQQQPSPPVVAGGSLPAATARTPPPDNILHKKYENCSKSEMKGITS